MADTYSPTDLLNEVRGRLNEAYMLQSYDGRIMQKRLTEWHHDIAQQDKLYRGEFTTLYPDETAKIKTPMVMNTVQTGNDDIARLCMESVATVKCPPQGQKDQDTTDSRMRGSAMMTWWDAGQGELLIPSLAMDLNLCGVMLLACILEPTSPYPVPYRIDPRWAYPALFNNHLVDLMVAQTVHVREAAARFGDVFRQGFQAAPKTLSRTESVDVVDYYGPEILATAVVFKEGNQGKHAFFVQYSLNTLGRIPVAFQKRPTGDGALRGIYSQAGGKLLAGNQIMQLELDYLDQGIHSQVVQRDTDVKEVGLGFPEKPITLLSETATISRLQPAIAPPQVWNLVQMLDQNTRGEVNYPAARQGDLSESIVSAAGITAHQGALATLVRDTNRILGAGRQEWNEIAALMDPPGEKPLLYPVGNTRTYDPEKVWAGKDGKCQNYNRVIYSIGSGLDKPTQNVAILQALGAGIITKEIAIEQMDYSADPGAVMQKIEEAETADILKQKFLGDPNTGPDMLAKVLAIQADGFRFVEAVKQVQAELAAQQAQAQAQQQAQQAPQELPAGTPPEQVQAAQTSLEKGGVPGQAPEQSQGIQPAFSPPPLEQVVVR